jgi:hypothetical protein
LWPTDTAAAIPAGKFLAFPRDYTEIEDEVVTLATTTAATRAVAVRTRAGWSRN